MTTTCMTRIEVETRDGDAYLQVNARFLAADGLILRSFMCSRGADAIGPAEVSSSAEAAEPGLGDGMVGCTST